MLFVITGNGKGKTCSALGMVERALGNGMRCLVIQFIKNHPSSYGEYRSLTAQGVAWECFGEGFIWEQKDIKPTEEICTTGFNFFKTQALSKKFDFIVLDEFTYPLNYKMIPEQEFLDFVAAHKNEAGFPHLVVTGRSASETLIGVADTVSEIMEVKHHWVANGRRPLKGIEF